MRKNEGSPLLLKAHIEATTDKFVQKNKKNNYNYFFMMWLRKQKREILVLGL